VLLPEPFTFCCFCFREFFPAFPPDQTAANDFIIPLPPELQITHTVKYLLYSGSCAIFSE